VKNPTSWNLTLALISNETRDAAFLGILAEPAFIAFGSWLSAFG
jgi:hypothetical protein